MRNPSHSFLKALSILILFLGIQSCSNSTSNNNNQNTNSSSSTQSLSAAPLKGTDCGTPLNVYISDATFQSKGIYQLTYTWNSVNNATGYDFDLTINGISSYQSLNVTDTTITFNQAMSAIDTIQASITTVCGTEKSTLAVQSSAFVYMNAVSTDEIIFLVNPNTSVDDICSRTCQKLKFTGGSLKNSDGSTINISSFAAQIYYFDFNTVKNCIQCVGNTAPLVDPLSFNTCLTNPANQFWLFDPGAYTVCP